MPGRPALAVVGLGAAAALLADVLLESRRGGLEPDRGRRGPGCPRAGRRPVARRPGGSPPDVGRTADERTARAAAAVLLLATIGIAVVAVTGLLRAIAEVGTVDALLTTDFGHLVIAKTALLAVLAPAWCGQPLPERPGRRSDARWAASRRIDRTPGRHHRPAPVRLAGEPRAAGRGRLGGRCIVRRARVRACPRAIVSGHDFGTSVKVQLAISPGTAGFDTFTATVTDYDTGAPVPADGVSLRFVFPARSDVGSSRLDLAPTGPGRLRGHRHEPLARRDVADHGRRCPWHGLGRGPARRSRPAGRQPDQCVSRARRSTSTPSRDCRRSTRSISRTAGQSRSISTRVRPEPTRCTPRSSTRPAMSCRSPVSPWRSDRRAEPSCRSRRASSSRAISSPIRRSPPGRTACPSRDRPRAATSSPRELDIPITK